MGKKFDIDNPAKNSEGKKKFRLPFKNQKNKSKKLASENELSTEETVARKLSQSKLSDKEKYFSPRLQDLFPDFKENIKKSDENRIVAPLQDREGKNRTNTKKNPNPTISTSVPKEKSPKKSFLEEFKDFFSPANRAQKKIARKIKAEKSVAITGKKPKGVMKKKLDNIKDNIKSAFKKSKGKSEVSYESGLSPTEAGERLKAYLSKKNRGKPGRGR